MRISLFFFTSIVSSFAEPHISNEKPGFHRQLIRNLMPRGDEPTKTMIKTVYRTRTVTVTNSASAVADLTSNLNSDLATNNSTKVSPKNKKFNVGLYDSAKNLLTIRTGATTFETTIYNAGLVKNGIAVGFLPDDGSGGGTKQTLSQIESALNIKSAAQGWYAQCYSGTLFDGSQFNWRKNEIIANGGVFQPAVMPMKGWWGLTRSDNRQAVAICKVMKTYTDAGLEVWLRFAHEINWYLRDGTYQGSLADFKEGWATVAAACKTHAPLVKMWFTPNIANLAEYDKFFPDDPSTVDLIGIDYYPNSAAGFNFIGTMKPFHDKYTNEKTKFAIAEIGLGTSGTMAQRLAWLKSMLSSDTKEQMPNYIQMSWFNYYKGHDFRIGAVNGDSVVKDYLLS